MTTFVDTSALYAVLDRDDRFHPHAAAVWTALVGSHEPLVTSNYVLVEVFALVQRRLGMQAVRGLADGLMPVLQTIWVREEDHRSAQSVFAAANRRELSLVDCVSFHLMRASGVRSVFAFDTHFAEQGFTVVPSG